jgi:Raf kinase inhibitor-like YbhB/YbcL family protein
MGRIMRNVVRVILGAILILGVSLGARAQQTPPPEPAGPPPSLLMGSTAFHDLSRIPTQYTCAATTPPPSGPRNISTGISPEMGWTNEPKGTVSYVLILHDPDAHVPKAPTDVTHWIIFNIPAGSRALGEGIPPGVRLPDGTLQGMNVTGKEGYQGPCAPPGAPHHYMFELQALDEKLDLPQGATREQIEDAIKGHVLGSAVYIALFNR